MINIGNRYRVKYGDWVSDCTYEVISNVESNYIIGIDINHISIRDSEQIDGWNSVEYKRKSGMRYNKFWCVDRSELIECSKNLEIE